MLVLSTCEDHDQFALLNAPAGAVNSARVRYAAAMYFFMQGQLPAGPLEIYRALSRRDDQDPRPVLYRAGWAHCIEQQEKLI
jgi:hypothetical protein